MLALKWPASKLMGRGKTMVKGPKNWRAVTFWVKLNESKIPQKFRLPYYPSCLINESRNHRGSLPLFTVAYMGLSGISAIIFFDICL